MLHSRTKHHKPTSCDRNALFLTKHRALYGTRHVNANIILEREREEEVTSRHETTVFIFRTANVHVTYEAPTTRPLNFQRANATLFQLLKAHRKTYTFKGRFFMARMEEGAECW